MTKITDLEAFPVHHSYDYNIAATIRDDGTGGDSHRETIARVYDEWLDPDTKKYAHLLAAAPELLAVAVKIVELDLFGIAYRKGQDFQYIADAARAAIAKAREVQQ